MRALSLLILLLFFIPLPSQSNMFITVDRVYKTDYYFTLNAWDENDNTPNPCYGDSLSDICLIGFAHYEPETGYIGPLDPVAFAYYIPLEDLFKTKTLGGLASLYKKSVTLPFHNLRVRVSPKPGQGEVKATCVMFSFQKRLASKPSPVPGVTCGMAPPPDVRCEITNNFIELNHGTLSSSDVQGHRVSTSLEVQCDMDTALKVSIASEQGGRFYLDAGRKIYSDLTINGIPADKGYQFKSAASTVMTISSTLGAIGQPESGDYSNQTVAILSIP